MSRILVALNPSRRIADFIFYATSIADQLAKDPRFASPPRPLATVRAHIEALREAEVTTRTRRVGTVAERDARLALVRSDLMTLRAYVQNVADENPVAAAEIVAKAGMSVKNARGPAKGGFVVKQGAVSGTVHLWAKAERTRASYDWEYGTDESSWTRVDSTVRADTVLKGLTPALGYFFRYRSVTKAGVGDWSQVLSLFVG